MLNNRMFQLAAIAATLLLTLSSAALAEEAKRNNCVCWSNCCNTQQKKSDLAPAAAAKGAKRNNCGQWASCCGRQQQKCEFYSVCRCVPKHNRGVETKMQAGGFIDFPQEQRGVDICTDRYWEDGCVRDGIRR